MLKYVLILMLVSNDTGEIKAVQQPKGFVTKDECYEAASRAKTSLSGHHIQFQCIPGLAYTST